MTRNVGRFERLARLILAILILGLYGALDPPWKFLTLIGLIPLATALTGFCPLYAALRINRCEPPASRRMSS